MTATEFIKMELKREIEKREKWLDERVGIKDYSGALKIMAEIDGLQTAWQIVCSSASFEK